jgi:hypothetical protein
LTGGDHSKEVEVDEGAESDESVQNVDGGGRSEVRRDLRTVKGEADDGECKGGDVCEDERLEEATPDGTDRAEYHDAPVEEAGYPPGLIAHVRKRGVDGLGQSIS